MNDVVIQSLADSSNAMVENVGTAVGLVTSQLEAMVTTIAGQPILLLGVGVWLVGAGVGLAKRLIRG